MGTSVDFLDIRLFKGPKWSRTGRLDFTTFRKKTALGIPLSDSSYHPPSVHSGWPSSLYNKINSRCSDRVLAAEAKLSFINEIAAGCPGHVALGHLTGDSR